jgi:hypothetical protein
MAWPPVAILALLLLYFGPAIAQGLMLGPHDGISLNYPLRLLWSEVLRSGEWPFWNPYNFGGIPFFGAMHAGVLFPGNWFFLFLPPLAAWNALVLFAYWVAGTGMYAFGRALELGRTAAMAMAVAFMLGGFMMGHLEQIMMVQTAAFVPALLWAIERFRRTLRVRFALAAMAFLTLQVLVGFPMVVALGMVVIAPYALVRGLGLDKPDRRRYALGLLGAGALAAGLCMAQLLPVLDFIPATQRSAIPYDYLTYHSLHPRQILLYWFPLLFGGPVSWMSPIAFWGIGPYLVEIVGYMGLLTLAAAAAALADRRRDRAVWFWLGLAALGLLLSFGRYTPLYHVWAALPVLKTMPGAGRHALEVDVALAVLAGYGLQALLTAGPAERRRRAAWGLAVAAVPVLATVVGVALLGPTLAARMAPYMPAHLDVARALTLANPGVWWPLVVALGTAVALGALALRPGPAARGLLLAVLTLDLVVFGQHVSWRQTSPTPGDLLVTEAPARPVSEDRLLSVAALRFPYDDVPHVTQLHYALFGALRGERAIGGYDSFYYARYGQLVGIKDSAGMLTDPRVWEPRHHVFDVLTLRTLRLDAALADTPTWRARLTPDRWRPVGREPGVAVYENQRRLPRAWRPDAALALAPDTVDAHMRGEAPWDPRRQALLDAPAVPPAASPGTAEATTLSMNRIRVDTQGAGPGLVLVSEGYDPGWKAFSGDRELRVHRADALILGIEVPAGRHSIELRYEPPRWRLGLALSALSLILAVIWALWGVRRSRRRTASPPTPAPETAAPPPS